MQWYCTLVAFCLNDFQRFGLLDIYDLLCSTNQYTMYFTSKTTGASDGVQTHDWYITSWICLTLCTRQSDATNKTKQYYPTVYIQLTRCANIQQYVYNLPDVISNGKTVSHLFHCQFHAIDTTVITCTLKNTNHAYIGTWQRCSMTLLSLQHSILHVCFLKCTKTTYGFPKYGNIHRKSLLSNSESRSSPLPLKSVGEWAISLGMLYLLTARYIGLIVWHIWRPFLAGLYLDGILVIGYLGIQRKAISYTVVNRRTWLRLWY